MPADAGPQLQGLPAARKPAAWIAVAAIAYVAVVLAVDTLAVQNVKVPIHWNMFQWHVQEAHAFLAHLGMPEASIGWLRTKPLSGIDFFKLIFWFAIPFAFSLPRLEWAAFGFGRWKRIDGWLLASLVFVGAAAVAIIPFVPSLHSTYGGGASKHVEGHRLLILMTYLGWQLSWLPGWEFLHRYVLLRKGSQLFPRFGWLLVPFSEGVYHLQKPLIEALGMVAISLVLTWWAMKRRNVLLPFLVHFVIEMELLVFLLFM